MIAEKSQNYETVKGGCIPSKNKFKAQKTISQGGSPRIAHSFKSKVNSKMRAVGHAFACE